MIRWNYTKVSAEPFKKLNELATALQHTTLDKTLTDLVNLRASQMNGCAFCVDMHVKEARMHGERDLRVHHVAVWRESPLFSERERAVLEWTEVVTKLDPVHPVPDEVYERVRAQLSEQEISDLTYKIGMINFWNRMAISTRSVPGSADKMYGLDRAGY